MDQFARERVERAARIYASNQDNFIKVRRIGHFIFFKF